MSDLNTYLRFISRVRFVGIVAVLASITLAVLLFTSVITGTAAVFTGIGAGILLVIGIGVLLKVSSWVDELEASLRQP